MSKELLPFEIILKIFKYIPNNNFSNIIVINKYISNDLKHEIFMRKHKFIINKLIYNTQCFSNINLGNKNGGIFRCRSKKDIVDGSVFCNFCNFIHNK